jgi:hypothetical protein
MKTRERRTPPSQQALDRAVLVYVNKHPEGSTIYPIVGTLSNIWCDIDPDAVQESLNRLVASGALTATIHQVSWEIQP